MDPITVFLTGGTGYLGGELLRQLLASGYQVRMLARRASAACPSAQVELVEGDLSDPNRLADQIRGCRAVIHSAALVASWVPKEVEFYRTNVDGLRNVMAASERAGVHTLVYTSTFFALGPSPLPGATEEAALEGSKLHPYQHSKLLARIEAAKARLRGFPIVILYPGVIYGPGRKTQGNLVDRLVSDFAGGRMPGMLGDGSQVWCFSYVKDVASGHVLALEKSPAGGEFVLGGENASLRDFFLKLGRLIGKPAPRLKVPRAFGMLLGGVESSFARLRRRAPRLTPSTIKMMYQSWACDSSRARRELGYNPVSLEQGLRETLESMNVTIADCGFRIAD